MRSFLAYEIDFWLVAFGFVMARDATVLADNINKVFLVALHFLF